MLKAFGKAAKGAGTPEPNRTVGPKGPQAVSGKTLVKANTESGGANKLGYGQAKPSGSHK
jgi:hypothetical protein